MYNDILYNIKFKRAMADIEKSERDRKFCCHSIEHSLDVARIAYIISLEKGLGIDKDLIYTAALLHDIGRCMGGENHDVNSARMAEEIMRECGYDPNTADTVVNAILHHREKSSAAESLRDIISIADKQCRQCWNCRVYDECRWRDEDKNKLILR